MNSKKLRITIESCTQSLELIFHDLSQYSFSYLYGSLRGSSKKHTIRLVGKWLVILFTNHMETSIFNLKYNFTRKKVPSIYLPLSCLLRAKFLFNKFILSFLFFILDTNCHSQFRSSTTFDQSLIYNLIYLLIRFF